MGDVLLTTTFEAITCCQKDCGMRFAMDAQWMRLRRQDHAWWYCPNGHVQHFSGKSDAERLKEELEAEKARRQYEVNSTTYWRERARADERSKIALRGAMTRLKRRVGNGERHVKSKHPDFVSEGSSA